MEKSRITSKVPNEKVATEEVSLIVAAPEDLLRYI